MEITDRQLKNLFTINNMIPVTIPKGGAGQNVGLKINGADVNATYLVNLEAGQAIALLTDKGNWYLVGEATLSIVQSTRRIIEYRRTDNIRPKISNLYYLYLLNNKVYVSNNIINNLINLPDNFSSNIYRSYIHNDGNKYRLAFSNGVDSIGGTIINYSNKNTYYNKTLDGILLATQYTESGSSLGNNIDYKGSCIWKSSNLSPILNQISFYGSSDTINYKGISPFDSIASGYIERSINSDGIYTYTGAFNSPTYFYTLNGVTETYNTGNVSYDYNSFDNGVTDISTINSSGNTTNTTNIDTNIYDYFISATAVMLAATVDNRNLTKTYNYTNTFPVICFNKGTIYCVENNSIFTKVISGYNPLNQNNPGIFTNSIRNRNYYFNSNSNIIQLNSEPILNLISDTEINITSSTTSITLTSSNEINGFNFNYIDTLSPSDFINKQILIAKKNTNGYILYRGNITNIIFNVTSNVLASIVCDITITGSETKPYISFASTNGTLIVNEGSIYTYLHQSDGNIAISNNNVFTYTTNVDWLNLTANQVYRESLISKINLINNRIQKDNLNNNNIYITNIPNFNKGGNLVAYIEVWNIGNDGKILYQKTLTQRLSNIPKNATLYAASYYK